MVLFREIGRQNRFWNAHRILNSQNVLLGNASETSKRVGGRRVRQATGQLCMSGEGQARALIADLSA